MSELCNRFRQNPTVNPLTERSITVGGPTYNKLSVECGLRAAPSPKRRGRPATKAPEQNIVLTREQALAFNSNSSVNPISGKTIKVGGATYNKLLDAYNRLAGYASPSRVASPNIIASRVASPRVASPKVASPKSPRSPRHSLVLTVEQALAFNENHTINPITGKTIQVGKGVYNELVEAYERLRLGVAPVSPTRGAVKYQLTEAECNAFRLNSKLNPRTGRAIDIGGATHKALVKSCNGAPAVGAVMSPAHCQQFLANPNINPLTGNAIKTGGKKQLELYKSCGFNTKAPRASKSKKPAKVYVLDQEQARAFLNNQGYNPLTGRVIDINGPIHKKLLEAANNVNL